LDRWEWLCDEAFVVDGCKCTVVVFLEISFVQKLSVSTTRHPAKHRPDETPEIPVAENRFRVSGIAQETHGSHHSTASPDTN